MATDQPTRKLAAILSADVKGYSRLMEDDEEATVATITAYRQVLARIIMNHRGRVVDAPGDNVLAEFASVVDAVESALEIQEDIQARNSELPDDRRMEFRIGINLGDVIEEEGQLYGDGVNIAARLEGLAEAGGICLSAAVYEQVKAKLDVEGKFLGQYDVKNISEPVRVWSLLTDAAAVGRARSKQERRKKSRKAGLLAAFALVVAVLSVSLWTTFFRPGDVAFVDKKTFPLPDKPSIAVLPFDNLSGDLEQEYLVDGLTEHIITVLSKIPEMFVIARNSSFTYKGKPVMVQQVGEELGVGHVVEGSIQKSGDRVRVTAQLVDAQSGHHLWAEHYDRKLEDLFAIQDEIAMKILTAMEVKLTQGEGARLLATGTDSLEAYLKVLQALEQRNHMDKEGVALALQLLEEAIALDPDYPAAYAALATTHWVSAWFRLSKDPRDSIKQAFEAAQQCLALDKDSPLAHGALGIVYLLKREHDVAIAESEKAVSLAPSWADGHFILGMTLLFADRVEEAIPSLERAIRLDPLPRSAYLHILGMAYREAGRYHEAIKACQRAIHIQPSNVFAHLILASTYSILDRMDDAEAEAHEVLRYNPKFSLERLAQVRPHIDPENTARFVATLRKAGLD